MKTTKILLGALRISALIALFAVAMPAKAQTVNVNFNGNGDTYTGTGAASDTGTFWNSATSAPFTAKTFSSLLNSAGGTSTVAVTMTNPDTANPYDASAVSYTHLDVYKRQPMCTPANARCLGREQYRLARALCVTHLWKETFCRECCG